MTDSLESRLLVDDIAEDFNLSYFDENFSISTFNASLLYDCSYTPYYSEEKFYIVLLVGTSLAIFSVIENCVLFYLLLSRAKYHSSYLFYITILSFMDIFIAISYIAVISVSYYYDYTSNLIVHAIWHVYVLPIFTLSYVAMAVSTFLLMSATFERFVVVMEWQKLHFTPQRRKLAAIVSVLGKQKFAKTASILDLLWITIRLMH